MCKMYTIFDLSFWRYLSYYQTLQTTTTTSGVPYVIWQGIPVASSALFPHDITKSPKFEHTSNSPTLPNIRLVSTRGLPSTIKPKVEHKVKQAKGILTSFRSLENFLSTTLTLTTPLFYKRLVKHKMIISWWAIVTVGNELQTIYIYLVCWPQVDVVTV